MNGISRRGFLCLSALAPLLATRPAARPATAANAPPPPAALRRTVAALKEAYAIETRAHRVYLVYTRRAIEEDYPNIAYLFRSFAVSERIHADLYDRVLAGLGQKGTAAAGAVAAGDTKENLQTAARNELQKIETTYPGLIRELEVEAYEEAVIGCMYSFKSHRQHEAKLRQIEQYAGYFFGSVSRRIEGLSLDLHVCRVCGSTIDRPPDGPCEICNRSQANYRRIERPA